MVDYSEIGFGFDQWGNQSNRENIFFGCYNNCLYCGVRKTQCLRFKRRDWFKWDLMKFKRESYRSSFSKRKNLSIFPTAHDLFPFNKMLSFKFLRKLIAPSNSIRNKVLVVSKPRLSVFRHFVSYFRDLKDYIEIRFTITTPNNDQIHLWEGNSPEYEERIECLSLCYEKGYNISIVIEPYLCNENSLYQLIDKFSTYNILSIWIGKMNRISTRKKLLELGYGNKIIKAHQQIRELSSEKHLKSIVLNLKNNEKIKYKESFIKKVGEQIPQNQIKYIT
jgi:DNA repair photolyase